MACGRHQCREIGTSAHGIGTPLPGPYATLRLASHSGGGTGPPRYYNSSYKTGSDRMRSVKKPGAGTSCECHSLSRLHPIGFSARNRLKTDAKMHDPVDEVDDGLVESGMRITLRLTTPLKSLSSAGSGCSG